MDMRRADATVIVIVVNVYYGPSIRSIEALLATSGIRVPRSWLALIWGFFLVENAPEPVD
jgi:hypothetical protein